MHKFAIGSLVVGFLSAAFPALAGPPADPPAETQSIDDALLDDLENELLDGLGDLPKPAKEQAPQGKGGDRPKGDRDTAADDADRETPIDDGPDPSKDPLGYISQQMRDAEQLIAERQKQPHAQALQKRIVEDLAKLIEQAEQQQAQQQASSQQKNQQQTAKRQSIKQPQQGKQSSSGKDSNAPAQDSSNRLGRAEQARPDPELLRGLMKDAWGHLPDRDREQMRQMAPERFLPQYELMIERYYRRLAEERAP